MPQILSMIAEFAPESYSIVMTLLGNKVKDRDILMVLLVINLEQTKKLNTMCTDLEVVKEKVRNA